MALNPDYRPLRYFALCHTASVVPESRTSLPLALRLVSIVVYDVLEAHALKWGRASIYLSRGMMPIHNACTYRIVLRRPGRGGQCDANPVPDAHAPAVFLFSHRARVRSSKPQPIPARHFLFVH